MKFLVRTCLAAMASAFGHTEHQGLKDLDTHQAGINDSADVKHLCQISGHAARQVKAGALCDQMSQPDVSQRLIEDFGEIWTRAKQASMTAPLSNLWTRSAPGKSWRTVSPDVSQTLIEDFQKFALKSLRGNDIYHE